MNRKLREIVCFLVSRLNQQHLGLKLAIPETVMQGSVFSSLHVIMTMRIISGMYMGEKRDQSPLGIITNPLNCRMELKESTRGLMGILTLDTFSEVLSDFMVYKIRGSDTNLRVETRLLLILTPSILYMYIFSEYSNFGSIFRGFTRLFVRGGVREQDAGLLLISTSAVLM